MSEPVARGLVPPRPISDPNHGPRISRQPPCSSPRAPSLASLWCSPGAYSNGNGRAAEAGGQPEPHQPDETPRGRLLALSQSVREALTVQFGASSRAKTTEELSTDAQLEQVLGPEGLRELIRFLDHVDRLKFAPERPSRGRESLQTELATWQPRVDELRKQIHVNVATRGKSASAPPAPTLESGAHPSPKRRDDGLTRCDHTTGIVRARSTEVQGVSGRICQRFGSGHDFRFVESNAHDVAAIGTDPQPDAPDHLTAWTARGQWLAGDQGLGGLAGVQDRK